MPSDAAAFHGPGWTLDQPRNHPDVDPALVDTWLVEAPLDPSGDAAALYEWATTPEGF